MGALETPAVLDRSKFLGGSDVAAILGVSPWTTPLKLFLEKTGQAAPEATDAARERAFKRGKRAEPHGIDMLIDDYGIKVTRRSTPSAPNRYIDPEINYLAAEIDFEFEITPELAARFDLDAGLIGTIQNGEIKSVHPFASAKFGEAETDEIPVEYAAQAMHGLMVTNRQLTMFGVLTGWDDLSVYWIKRDDETIAGMRRQEIGFWENHVLARIPPAPVNLPDVLNLFGRTVASRIEATEEILGAVQKLIEARDTAKVSEDAQIEYKFQIGRYMLGEAGITLANGGKLVPGADVKPGEHQLLFKGAPVLVVQKQSQRRLDGDALKAKYPEAALECQKTIELFKFAKPKGKSK